STGAGGGPITTTVATESHRLQDVHGQLVRIIRWGGLKSNPDRYAELLSRHRSPEAEKLIKQVFGEFAHWQRASGKGVRKLRAKSGQPYHDAIERFVGGLLRARADTTTSGRIYRATGKNHLKDEP